uniref:Uncharacterized protein n=1 Tax=Schizaphis graminum TaxID=13262 RepID=A0A2S2NSJ8_SCHGA
MKQNEFLNFAKIVKGPLVLRKVNEEGDKFLWHDISWVRYCASMISKMFYKTNLSEDEPFKTLNLIRRGTRNLEFALEQAYNEPLPISKEKKKDLIDLLPLIPDIYHDFYKNIKSNESEDLYYDPDLSESD